MVIKRIVGWPHTYGGEEHQDWLPTCASEPLPTPIRQVLVDLEIDGDSESGYLLIQTAQDGSFSWDTWYASIADADAAAAELYGVSSDAWQSP